MTSPIAKVSLSKRGSPDADSLDLPPSAARGLEKVYG
jgi:hypothetical protein